MFLTMEGVVVALTLAGVLIGIAVVRALVGSSGAQRIGRQVGDDRADMLRGPRCPNVRGGGLSGQWFDFCVGVYHCRTPVR
jgi:hypothetical protein